MAAVEQTRGIQSLEAGLHVLKILREVGGPLSLKELATSTGMSASKLHRYCASLIRAGFIEQVSRGNYRYTNFTDSTDEQQKRSVLNRILEHLPHLVQETSHSTFLAEWKPRGLIIIHVEVPDHPISVRPRVALPLPAFTSSTGQAFLAAMSEAERNSFIEKERTRLLETNTPASLIEQEVSRLSRRLATTRRYRLGRTTGDHIKGISSLAAAICINSKVQYVVTIYGISETFESTWDGKNARSLLNFTKRMSE